ncbi:MAG: glycosyltransferase [Myxococcales bacterium]|nr:glycosyltransferase [Myxococcales bacterium]
MGAASAIRYVLQVPEASRAGLTMSAPARRFDQPTRRGRARRVLHVFGTMHRGGAELRTVEIMRRTDPALVVQEFAALSGAPGTLDDEIRQLGGAVHPCRLDAGFAPRFMRLIRERGIDVVHSHVFLTSGLMLALAFAVGVPQRIAHFRSTSDGQPSTVRRRAYRLGMRRMLDFTATDLLGVSAASLAEGWSPEWQRDPRCQVIYNGVDPARFADAVDDGSVRAELGVPPGTPLLVQVGRFDPPKNHLFTATLLPLLPHAHVVFVGRGGTALEAETRRRLAASGCLDRAHFVGERPDVGRWLVAADASILPSVIEGLPGVVLESLACGTPVVAADLPGVHEIAERVEGVTVVTTTSPRPWADALQAMSSPTPAARARRRAVLAASPFTIDAAVAAHVALWTRPSRRGDS